MNTKTERKKQTTGKETNESSNYRNYCVNVIVDKNTNLDNLKQDVFKEMLSLELSGETMELESCIIINRGDGTITCYAGYTELKISKRHKHMTEMFEFIKTKYNCDYVVQPLTKDKVQKLLIEALINKYEIDDPK